MQITVHDGTIHRQDEMQKQQRKGYFSHLENLLDTPVIILGAPNKSFLLKKKYYSLLIINKTY